MKYDNNWLDRVLKAKGKTRAELCFIMGVSDTNLRFKLLTNPRLDVYVCISKALHITLSELFAL